MGYSLAVVQPRLRRFLATPQSVEAAYRELAAGNRWPVAGLIAVLGASGVGLALGAGPRPAAWWLLITGKAALLLLAAGLFWWVSWRARPRRVFALPEELPPLQRRFRRVAATMAVAVGGAFLLGSPRSRSRGSPAGTRDPLCGGP